MISTDKSNQTLATPKSRVPATKMQPAKQKKIYLVISRNDIPFNASIKLNSKPTALPNSSLQNTSISQKNICSSNSTKSIKQLPSVQRRINVSNDNLKADNGRLTVADLGKRNVSAPPFILKRTCFSPGYKNPFDYSTYAKTQKTSMEVKSYKGDQTPLTEYKCLICSKKGINKDSLIEHYEYHKKAKDKLKNRTTEQQSADAVTFETPKTIDKLTSVHNDQVRSKKSPSATKYKCQTCKATGVKVLSKHVCDPKRLTCACSECGKKFTNVTALKFHMRVHGSRRFVCTVCDKSFYQSSSLTCHMRIHNGEKPYKCNACGKGFSQRTAMVIHQRTHTGERPYSCENCSRDYISRSGLNVHLKTCRLFVQLPPS